MASGPGGQNVNKVSSAVQLRFNAAASLALPEPVRFRLMILAGGKLTKDGVVVLTVRQFRDQVRNRAAARERLFEMIREAAISQRSAARRNLPERPRKNDCSTKKNMRN